MPLSGGAPATKILTLFSLPIPSIADNIDKSKEPKTERNLKVFLHTESALAGGCAREDKRSPFTSLGGESGRSTVCRGIHTVDLEARTVFNPLGGSLLCLRAPIDTDLSRAREVKQVKGAGIPLFMAFTPSWPAARARTGCEDERAPRAGAAHTGARVWRRAAHEGVGGLTGGGFR